MRQSVKRASKAIPVLLCTALLARGVAASGSEPTSSLMARALRDDRSSSATREDHALLGLSMFAIAPPKLRTFQTHDLVQIIVRESSRAESKHELETEKDYNLDGDITAWPDIRIKDLLNFQMRAGRTTDLPAVRVGLGKEFEGDGEYKREDDLTARLTAEVVTILPNDNLVLEARTHIKTDEEESTIRVTGVCRPEDVTAANTIFSGQLHDLKIEKIHVGELKRTNERGIITKVLDTLFAF